MYIATAQAWDEEMRERIARHQRQRADRVPRHDHGGRAAGAGPCDRPAQPRRHADRGGLPHAVAHGAVDAGGGRARTPKPAPDGEGTVIAGALRACAGPLVLISNEIGLGVIPMGRDVRTFVDALGGLNQQAAAACERVTLMSAGLPLTLKGSA